MNFFTEIIEGLGIAWDAIRANRLRSVLTTLGIIIGIVTVTLMATAINGLNKSFHNSVSTIGADVLFVSRIAWIIESEAEWQRQNKRREISMQQVKLVERDLPMAESIAPVFETRQSVVYKNHSSSLIRIVGTTDQYIYTAGFSMEQGRFLSETEAAAGRPVCVVGTNVANKLFQRESAIGKKINVGGRELEVIGVIEKRGSFLKAPSLDDKIIIPIPQLLTGFTRDPDFTIQVKVSDVAISKTTRRNCAV